MPTSFLRLERGRLVQRSLGGFGEEPYPADAEQPRTPVLSTSTNVVSIRKKEDLSKISDIVKEIDRLRFRLEDLVREHIDRFDNFLEIDEIYRILRESVERLKRAKTDIRRSSSIEGAIRRYTSAYNLCEPLYRILNLPMSDLPNFEHLLPGHVPNPKRRKLRDIKKKKK